MSVRKSFVAVLVYGSAAGASVTQLASALWQCLSVAAVAAFNEKKRKMTKKNHRSDHLRAVKQHQKKKSKSKFLRRSPQAKNKVNNTVVGARFFKTRFFKKM